MSPKVIRIVLLASLVAAPALAAETDPYEALGAMAGHWTMTTGSGRIEKVDNACARTGLWYVCAQSIEDKPAALVVFQPIGRGDGKLTFRVQTLVSGGDRPGPWKDLVIEGTTWTVSEPAHASRRRTRTVITHSGPDYMHAEVQVEGKGDTWIPVSSDSFARR